MTETPQFHGSDTPTPPTGFPNPLFVQQQVPQQQPPPARKPRRGMALVAAAAVAAALVGGTAGAVYTSTSLASPGSSISSSDSGGATATPASNQNSGTVSSVAAAGLPSVVQIQTQNEIGSGVVISSDGQILTNNHVVAGAGTVKVTFNDGSSATGTVLGTDPTTDLAVVKVSGKSGLKVAALGDSSQVKVGDKVVAIGSPEGLQGTVTSGIVSALNRTVTASDNQSGGSPYTRSGNSKTTYKGMIQTDASINPGNSGGALFNMQGQVIGINSVIYAPSGGSAGLGFAIPINQAKEIAKQLVAGN
ncbi:trypsin-like peptidase domain-containing protein [Kutzneria viridogrisea]|uniref:Protease n=2 Tax=Kutzneria TaxID=43356 RepID=W5W3M0_9PSEU|nr:trypsin-like peptidase domain-containing protein [Kutzneria albida]AHH95808.1 protease [Kutzneria albida DSM 43870]MBA8926672.1 putative serine protease PepD [Kutzneria viridogrisea]